MIKAWLASRERLNQAIDHAFLTLWKIIFNFLTETGAVIIFFIESIRLIFVKPYRFDEIIKHIEFVGNKSILIIVLTGAFTGMAMSYQIYLGFNLVNATNLVGPTVALGITRELGPVLTGLIVSARAGGAMAARIGTMRVSEQIDALEVMGLDPKQYLVSPRILAAFISMPLLCGVFDFVAMTGAYVLCVKLLGLDEAIFWDKIQLWLNPRDINEGLIKSAAFGLIFASICTYRGYNTKGGAKGVGEATNTGVVYSMVMIIIMNFFMTNVIRFYYKVMGIK
ncbi:MAG: ABC transporter permease [Bdellovibrionales bacterium]|nr:ABC transporter permease [Bdellovibrionales bacterium]